MHPNIGHTSGPYDGVALRHRRMYLSIPYTHLSFSPVLDIRTDYLVLPVVRTSVVVVSVLVGVLTGLPWWAVIVAATVGCSLAVLLERVGRIRQRRPLTASAVLTAAERARRNLEESGGPDLLQVNVAYIRDLGVRVLCDNGATDEQRRRAARLLRDIQ